MASRLLFESWRARVGPNSAPTCQKADFATAKSNGTSVGHPTLRRRSTLLNVASLLRRRLSVSYSSPGGPLVGLNSAPTCQKADFATAKSNGTSVGHPTLRRRSTLLNVASLLRRRLSVSYSSPGGPLVGPPGLEPGTKGL